MNFGKFISEEDIENYSTNEEYEFLTEKKKEYNSINKKALNDYISHLKDMKYISIRINDQYIKGFTDGYMYGKKGRMKTVDNNAMYLLGRAEGIIYRRTDINNRKISKLNPSKEIQNIELDDLD